MKTVSGQVVSTKSVSLFQAARTISAFVSSDNGGASQAVEAYLRRTSTSFNELVQFHEDHKNANLKKIKKTSRVDPVHLSKEGSLVKIGQKGIFGFEKKVVGSLGNGEEAEGIGGDWNGKEERGKKMKKGEGKEMDSESNLGIKKNIEGLGNEVNVNVKDGGRKKEERMKKREDVVREKEGNLGIKEEGEKTKRKRKRKSEVVDEGEIGNLTEQSGLKKKKRRRVEV